MPEPEISIRFDLPHPHPLFKKFHMFNSGLAPISRYTENLDALRRVRPPSIRIDLFLGDRNQEFGDVIDGTADEPVYQFEKLDRLTSLLLEEGILPYWSWCYIPLPLQPPGTDFKTGPTDVKRYGEMLEMLAKHYRAPHMRLGWQEVYNEPDCHGNLFSGTFADYLPMYRQGAPALKRGNPDIPVGGPAEAFAEEAETIRSNLASFMKLVREEELPLDYFSYHSYGWEEDEYNTRTRQVRALLEGDERFITTELHMNELNVIPPLWEYGTTCLTGDEPVPLILNCLEDLLAYHDLTVVHWAQLLNSGVDELSLVGLDGTYYPAFYAFELYARLPVSRGAAQGEGDIRCLAGQDERRTAALFWNAGGGVRDARVKLEGFGNGESFRIYELDAAFYQKAKAIPRCPLPEAKARYLLNGDELRVKLGPTEMLYIEADRGHPQPRSKLDIARLYHYFPNRNGQGFATIERAEQTAYLGTDGGTAPCAVAAEIHGAPDLLALDMAWFNPLPDALPNEELRRRFALRVDYRTPGGYQSAVRFGGEAAADAQFPWGTKRPADARDRLDGLSPTVDLAAHAPAGWDRTVLLSFLLNEAPANTQLRVGFGPA